MTIKELKQVLNTYYDDAEVVLAVPGETATSYVVYNVNMSSHGPNAELMLEHNLGTVVGRVATGIKV
jgi:hypothetical protein